MGDLWNARKEYVPEEYFAKWVSFCEKLDNATEQHIAKLLKFAEYHIPEDFSKKWDKFLKS